MFVVDCLKGNFILFQYYAQRVEASKDNGIVFSIHPLRLWFLAATIKFYSHVAVERLHEFTDISLLLEFGKLQNAWVKCH